MRRIYKNKSRNCPFSDDFLEGFNSGTEIQFEADVKVLEEIMAEIEQVKDVMNEEITSHDRKDLINFVNGLNQCLCIIDEHISGRENE